MRWFSLSLTPPAPNIPNLPSQQLLSSASESASIDHSRNVRGLAALTSMLALVAARGLSRGLLLIEMRDIANCGFSLAVTLHPLDFLSYLSLFLSFVFILSFF